jgi:hypothetical protein
MGLFNFVAKAFIATRMRATTTSGQRKAKTAR